MPFVFTYRYSLLLRFPMKSNALSLEYERDYGTAGGNLDVSNLINNPAANGVCRVFGLSFQKEITDLCFLNACSLQDNGSDQLLVIEHTV